MVYAGMRHLPVTTVVDTYIATTVFPFSVVFQVVCLKLVWQYDVGVLWHRAVELKMEMVSNYFTSSFYVWTDIYRYY